jgi:hypothetical protein
MRQKHAPIFPEVFQSEDVKDLKIIREYREKYKAIDAFLQKYSELFDAVHQDLQSLCTPNPSRERKSDFTTFQLFRALIVMKLENVTYRRASLLIGLIKPLQDFCHLFEKTSINHSLLCQAHRIIDSETWQHINQLFAKRMQEDARLTLITFVRILP